MSDLLEPRPTRRQRRRLAVLTAVTVTALVVAVVAWIGVLRSDPEPGEDERAAVLSAAGGAVAALMTFGPDDPPDQRRRTDALLADPLRLEYRNRGVDVVVPGARAASVSMVGRVVGAGLNDSSAERARVLVFVDQTVSVGDGEKSTGSGEAADAEGEATPTARWALMRKVDGNWLLSDLQPVGDVTR
ncbi:hypothetical protein GONAM_11_00450 [Gordonia namibiensis NBRC 108229]|uniref:Mce-associated membrane protein n=1 Tax=Gordonia namibiensis NBRC 108229 TaxID=1208314 RepID=K6WKI2_9ACTN|nr:hypothetical protein [Gordonia namibiensis]GAB99865.1 hypothetical protein GONAM_11_00450 [Gordonia namibiensis NBRC 108229]